MSKIAIMCHCISSGRDTVGGIARTGASVVAERHATGRWRLRGQEQSVLDGHRDHVHERRAVRQLQARPAAALLVTAVEQVPTPRLHQHHARASSSTATAPTSRSNPAKRPPFTCGNKTSAPSGCRATEIKTGTTTSFKNYMPMR